MSASDPVSIDAVAAKPAAILNAIAGAVITANADHVLLSKRYAIADEPCLPPDDPCAPTDPQETP